MGRNFIIALLIGLTGETPSLHRSNKTLVSDHKGGQILLIQRSIENEDQLQAIIAALEVECQSITKGKRDVEYGCR